MTYVGLFFVATVYLMNGLGLLGRIDARSAAPMNLMIAVFLLCASGYLLLPLGNLNTAIASSTMISAIGNILFGFAFLYVGITSYTNDSGLGFGWYCAWASAVSLGTAILYAVRFADFRYASLWCVWTVVFAALFVLAVLRAEHLKSATGWFVVLAGFTTCAYPGALQALNLWAITPAWQVAALCGLSLLVFLVLIIRAHATAPRGRSVAVAEHT